MIAGRTSRPSLRLSISPPHPALHEPLAGNAGPRGPDREDHLAQPAACAAQVFPFTSMGSVRPVSRANSYHTQRAYSNGAVCLSAGLSLTWLSVSARLLLSARRMARDCR